MSWVSRTYQIPDFSRECTEMNAKTPIIGPDPQDFNELCQALIDLSPDDIYAAGLKEGRRRERRALRRWGNVDLGGNVSRRVIVDQYLNKNKPDAWLASRKRGGA